MRIPGVLLIALVCLASLSVTPASASERASVLRSCSEQFGQRVDLKLNLFEVSRFYVLRAQFDSRGRLQELAVEPKYFHEEHHPDWQEPGDFAFISKAEYNSLLDRLDKIRPRGRLLRESPAVSVVSNLTAHRKEVYQNAVLEWGELVDLRRGENPPLQVRWLRLDFSRAARAGITNVSHLPRR